MPVIDELEFENCFSDMLYYRLQDELFTNLKRRKRPIRRFKLKNMFFEEVNLFEACAFANKGLICDELALVNSNVIESKEKVTSSSGGMLGSLLGRKQDQQFDPRFS